MGCVNCERYVLVILGEIWERGILREILKCWVLTVAIVEGKVQLLSQMNIALGNISA